MRPKLPFIIVSMMVAAMVLAACVPSMTPTTEVLPTIVPTVEPLPIASYKDATYQIDSKSITLVNGLSEVEAASGSATKIITRYFGNEAVGDLNGDGKEDIAFLLTQNIGGSGTFYYAVVALRTDTGYQGTNAVLLGDRIAPQSTNIENGMVVVNYADRKPGEVFTTEPSVGVSKNLKVMDGNLVEINTIPTPTTPAALNIVFTPGTTAAVEQGTAQPGQIITYTLYAGESQPMILSLESPNNDLSLGVLEANGNKVLDPAKKWNRWQWLLPKTEQFTIQVVGSTVAEDYTLTAKVAQLVSLASGTSSITLNGKTVNGYVFSYALYCKANQTMTVTLNVPSSTAYLDIFGLASGTLLSASAKANTWTGVLPEEQFYVIEVIPNNGQVVDYSLTVSVH